MLRLDARLLTAPFVALALACLSACGLVDALAHEDATAHEGVDDDDNKGDEGEGDEGDEGEGEGEGDGACASGPLLTARRIAVGFDRSCALTCSGAVVCWGNGDDVTPPSGAFASIAVGQSFACALDDAGIVSCWGFTAGLDEIQDAEAPLALSRIAAGQSFVCGLSFGGALACSNASDWPSFEAPSGAFSELAVGWGYVCAKRLDTGDVQCGGTSSRPIPPAGIVLTHIGVGSRFACGLDPARAIVCFDDQGPIAATPGAFADLSVGDGTGCGIGADDAHLACFTETDEGALVVEQAPAGRFVAVAVASAHACAIREDDAVLCWGSDTYGRVDVPAP